MHRGVAGMCGGVIMGRGRKGGETGLDEGIESAGDFGDFCGIGQSIQEIATVTGPGLYL